MRANMPSLHSPLRLLRGHRGRLALTVLALATGVAAVCSNSLMSRAVMGAFADVVDTAAGTAALQVRRGDGGPFQKDVAIAVARVPGIMRVVPVLTATAFTSDASGELLAVHAYDLADAAAGQVYGVEGGARINVNGARALLPGSVVLTATFAQRHHLDTGNRMQLDTPTGRQTFTVAGLVEATGLARLYGGNLIIMDLYAGQQAFARRGEINRVDVVLKPGADTALMAQRIRAALPPAMLVESPSDQKKALEKTTQSIHELLRVFIVGGLLAAFLIAFNSLSTLCEGRVWELSVLRAIGVRQDVLWRHLLLEALGLGVFGVIIGIPMGLAYAWALLPRIAQATALDTNVVVPALPFTIDASSLVLAAVLGLVTALAAAALPAWRAARVEVVETIRNRGLEQAEAVPGLPWPIRFVVVALAFIAVGVEVVHQSGPWGIIAGSLVVLATALLARPVTGVLSMLLARGLGRYVGPATRLALLQISERPRRASLLVAMVGVGVGSVLWLWMLAWSFQQSVIDTLTQSCHADLIVGSAHIGSAFLEVPTGDEVLAQLAGISGVRAAAGIRNVEVQYEGGTITLDADDPHYFLNPEFGRLLLGAQLPNVWESVARGKAIIASSNFMQNMGVRLGDIVTLPTPNGPLQVPIAGVTSHYFSPRGTLNLSRELYARMWGDDRISRAYVLLTRGADPSTVRQAIAASLGRAYNLRILSAPELIDYFASRVRAAFAGMYVHAAAILLVVFIGIGETLVAEVIARRWELGAVRVLGVQRRRLRQMVLVEAVVLGMMGLLLAGISGLAQGTLWVHTTFPYLFGFVLTLHTPYQAAATFAALTLTVCVLAALLPARHAARLQPAVALRHE